MPTEFGSFNFIGTLAAVINGLGIVRWLNSFADYLKKKDSMSIEYSWAYSAAALFQFVLHILLWWSLWSVRSGSLNFLSYLYMLLGPILLFIGSAFLAPEIKGDRLNLGQHYYTTRPVYASVLTLLWLWAIFASPVFRGHFAEQVPVLLMFLAVALVLRISTSSLVHRIAVVLNWIILMIFVLAFAIELGGMAPPSLN
jgi:hypothetical protein